MHTPALTLAALLLLSASLQGQQPAAVPPAEKKAEAAKSDQEQGVEHFYKGEIAKAIAAWDRHLAANPADMPYHWQRGLALYYAERWADGQQQFEEHQKVNTADVENAVWHFLCVTRGRGLDEARKRLIPIEGDARVPMAQIHALFSGKGTEEAVLAAAEESDKARSSTNARCYAHLYLGLYHEALGDAEKAKAHMLKSPTISARCTTWAARRRCTASCAAGNRESCCQGVSGNS